MTGQNFASYTRYLTKTTSTTFSDADIVLLSNTVKDEMATRINKANSDVFGMIYTTNLVANQREYSLPTDVLRTLKKLEAKFDGTNWIALNELDVSSLKRPTDETTITSYFSNEAGNAFFDIYRDSLFIYSGTISNVASGIQLYAMVWPEDIASGTLSLSTDIGLPSATDKRALPREFHKLWAEAVAIEYKQSKDRASALTVNEQKWEERFTSILDSLKNNNLDKVIRFGVPNVNLNLLNNTQNGYNL